MSERRWVAGAVVFIFAIWASVLASGFRVSFPTDPIGPRAFPFVAITLVALGGLSLWRPDFPAAESQDSKDARRAALATASFVLYALLLAPVGFLLATTAEFVALAVLFGGPPVRALITGFVLALVLYVLFVSGLGLPLPAGSLFS